MNRNLVILLSMVALPWYVASGTYLQGSVEDTLTSSGNPYYVIDDIFVESGHMLVIEQGVQLFFNAGVRFDIRDGATLVANGADGDSITFRPRDPVGYFSDIEFKAANSRGTFRYCVIDHGDGIHCNGSVFEFANSSIRNNRGPGIGYFDIDTLTVRDCDISNNGGSGISGEYGSLVMIEDNNFGGNNAGDYGYGGGIRADATRLTISRNTLSGNRAAHGGGIYAYGYRCLIENNTVTGNHGIDDAGGIRAAAQGEWGSLLVAGNYVSGNSVSGQWYSQAGGITVGSNVSQIALVLGNVVVNNTATMYPGLHGIGWFVNNVVCNNIGTDLGGGIWGDGSYAVNCIFWNNGPQEVYGQVYVWNCDIMGDSLGNDHNISLDPLFRDTTSNDYHLMSTACGDPRDSPCIDAGSDFFYDKELECNLGLGAITSDIGAYGGGGQYCHSVIFGDVNGDGQANGMDVVYLVDYFKGRHYIVEQCRCFLHWDLSVVADVNGDCHNNGMDIIYFVNYLKYEGAPLQSCPDCRIGMGMLSRFLQDFPMAELFAK